MKSEETQMNLYHQKGFPSTSTPFFPYIDLPKLPKVRKTINVSKSPKIQLPIKSSKSPELKTMCCRQIVEHKIQLVPPAKKGTTKVRKKIFTTIEKVCSEVVVILGFIRKTITYTAVIHNKEIPNHIIQDDVPFQCLIESTDIKEDHQFRIIEQKILSEVFAHETNFGKPNDSRLYRQALAFNFIEKDIIKISIK
ncbi:hypothetical protein COF46_03355 [Bacillus pseudomycoides]|nr:hypothetical protein COF46_03355 [Bacillus pseudomycoides]